MNGESESTMLRIFCGTLTAPLDHPDTQGPGIDRIAWHCELGIVAPLPGLFKGVQGMASAAVRTERIADKYLDGWWWTLVQKRNLCKKKESGADASGAVFPRWGFHSIAFSFIHT